MELKSSVEIAVILEKPAADTQIRMIVDGCNVKLNFPSKAASATVSDVKRMMLGGAIKT